MTARITLLQALLEHTRAGRIQWHEEDPDTYMGRGAGHEFQIRFDHPLVNDGTTTGADIVQVTIGRLILTFTSGTGGMELAVQTLAAGLPEWREHLHHVEAVAQEASDLLATLDSD